MSDRISVPAEEYGVVRVFTLDISGAEKAAYLPPEDEAGAEGWKLPDALGAERLDPRYVQVFALRELEGMGFSDYLVEGQGIAEEELSGDRGRLDGLSGHVAVLSSAAFGDRAQTLTPTAPARWIGTYREERGAAVHMPLHAESARKQTPDGSEAGGDAPAEPAGAGPSSRRMVLAGLALVLLLLAVLALAGGG